MMTFFLEILIESPVLAGLFLYCTRAHALGVQMCLLVVMAFDLIFHS